MSMRCGAWSASPAANSRRSMADAASVRKRTSRTAEASTTITADRVRRVPQAPAPVKGRPERASPSGRAAPRPSVVRRPREFPQAGSRTRLARQRRARFQATTQGVWHITNLDHSRHAANRGTCAAHVKRALLSLSRLTTTRRRFSDNDASCRGEPIAGDPGSRERGEAASQLSASCESAFNSS
jgi:hypothetical protein